MAWNDYVCPWAYLGRDRTALMRDLGVTVVQLPYELHPEIPAGGRAVRPGGRLDQVLTSIGAECDALGIPFRAPRRMPNTHHVLEVSEVVRLHEPAAFTAFDAALARAMWVDGLDLGDRDLVDELLVAAGAPAATVRELVAEGAGSRALEASMRLAREHGVMATPAWWVDDRLLIPGAQPRETIERWITRMQRRAT